MEEKFSITDSEMAFKAVALNGMAFQFVSHHLRTEALSLLAVGKNAHALKHVPVESRTEAVLLKAMESDVYVLPHIPEQAWSEALALKVVEKHALDLKNIPAEFCTAAVVLRAVQGNWIALEQVPRHLVTQSLVDTAVASCEKALQFAPAEFRTEEAALRAGITYQFNYRGCYQDEQIYGDGVLTTCIVPTRWLKMTLPTFSGGVVYTDNTDKTGLNCLVFEFAELESNGMSRTISLQIYDLHERDYHGNSKAPVTYFEAPVKIHCRAIEFSDANWCIELVLINHFFGTLNAESCWGNYFFDYADFFSFITASPEFIFEFGIGDTPAEIVPKILERVACDKAGDVFLVLYCDQDLFRLAFNDEIIQSFQSAFDESSVIFGCAGVTQDKMLISALVGCKPTATLSTTELE